MKTRVIVATIALTALSSFAGGVHSLNADWRFSWTKAPLPLKNAVSSMRQGGTDVFSPGYDDSGWEIVSVPHPVNAHDSFDDRAVDPGEATFRRDVMFYRKRFALNWGTGNGELGTVKAFLTFETVRQTIYVWVNGSFAGYYEAGIAPTAFDVSSLVKSGENVVCVATDNTAMRGSKHFGKETIPGHEPGDMSGAAYQWNTTDFNEVQGGLVGNVSLVVRPSKTYLTLPYYNNLKTVGTYVTARDFDFEMGEATICVKAEVRNEDASRRVKIKVEAREAGATGANPTVSAVSSVLDVPSSPSKVFLSAVESDVYEASPAPTRVASPETAFIEAECRAAKLKFWSPDTPQLYDVVVTLVDESGAALDSETIRTGFREVKYDAAKGGLLVNGKNVWLTGYAQRSTDEWAARRCENGEKGRVDMELKPFDVKGGLADESQQAYPANGRSFARKTDAPAVQDLRGDGASSAESYTVFVNGAKVAFPHRLGVPVKPDDNTGVCCAYVPVLEALKASGAAVEFVHEPKRIPASKKWLRKLSPTPFVPMVTVKAGGREIDACVGFTELFLDNGRDKNLTNCEIYRAREKSPVVCGELVSLVGYIPGVEMKTDTKKKIVEIKAAR